MEQIKSVIGLLKRVDENKERFLLRENRKEENTGCIFMSNGDRTCSPACELGIIVPTSVVCRWLDASATCPFCGLLSGTVS